MTQPRAILRTLAFFIVALIGVHTPASAQTRGDLQTFASHHYTIYTDLKREEARPFGAHMDEVFAEYSKRFAEFANSGYARRQSMPLYLFRTQSEYMQFLRHHHINGNNTEGLFFVQPDVQGLATWTQGKSLSHTYAVLQHEGFHQFAFNYIGTNLPVWVNEGIAQYFEDGILVNNQMYVGFANERRITAVRTALIQHHPIDFNRLLQMSQDQWHEEVIQGHEAGLLYDESWSIVYFLITAENGKYRAAFESYLMMVSKGRESEQAFRDAFGTEDTGPFRRRWEAFALTVQPDAITTALSRMEFLGQGLRFFQERGEPEPASLVELKDRLQRIDFQMLRTMQGVTIRYDARDNEYFRYPRASGGELDFKVLPPERDNLPPRIWAPGLRPEPTLVWTRDPQGELVQDIVFN